MRAVAAAGIGLLALSGIAGASGFHSRVLVSARLTALAADGAQAAYASTDCRVHMWNRTTGRVVRLGRGPACEQTSTGTAVGAISVAGNRALWLWYGGGNIREWLLFTATTARPKPSRLAFVTTEPEDRPPLVLGEGDVSRFGDLLPYAIGSRVVVLRSNGARASTWSAPARVTALAAKNGEVAVAVDGGAVYLLDAGGELLRTETFGATLDAVRLTGSLLVGQWGSTLEVHGSGSPKTYRLVAGARLADAEARRAVFIARGKVRLLNLDSGASRIVVAGSSAQLEGRSLTYASGRLVAVRRPALATSSG
jgi:hypothetical protein